jgi:hypothetical protein
MRAMVFARRGGAGLIVVGAIVASWLGVAPAAAVPIEFRFSGTGTGTAGGRSFTNAPFVITAVGDTDNVVEVPTTLGIIYSLDAPAVIDVTGIGSGQITTFTRVFENDTGGSNGQTPTVGLSRLPHQSGNDLLNAVDPSVLGYRLRTSFGPLFESDPQAFQQFNGVESALGLLTFTDVDSFTFQATVVPEPAGLVLLVGAAMFLRRRR